MPARRPDATQLAVWRQFLVVHATIVRQLERELLEQRELPLSWYDVLVQLQEAGGKLRMQQLAARLLVNKSSLTRVCDRMEELGLVERRSAPDDLRGVVAVLTRDGRETLRRAAPVHLRGVYRHFSRHLSEADVATLHRILGKLPSPEGGGEAT
jgi:DNA-binding MarR family transcriptional regulator